MGEGAQDQQEERGESEFFSYYYYSYCQKDRRQVLTKLVANHSSHERARLLYLVVEIKIRRQVDSW